MPLKIAAKVDRADQDYFDEQIKPLLAAANVEFIGEINDKDKSDFLSGAIAFCSFRSIGPSRSAW